MVRRQVHAFLIGAKVTTGGATMSSPLGFGVTGKTFSPFVKVGAL